MPRSIDDFAHVRDSRLRRLLAYWLAQRQGKLLPGRADIEPGDFVYALPYVWLCDFERATGRFRYRLAGDHVQAAHRRSLAGLYLEEFTSADAIDRVRRYYLAAVERPCVVHIGGRIYAEARVPARGERLLMPLAADGRTADMILGITVHSWDSLIYDDEPLPERQTRTFTPLDDTSGWIETT